MGDDRPILSPGHAQGHGAMTAFVTRVAALGPDGITDEGGE